MFIENSVQIWEIEVAAGKLFSVLLQLV